MPEIVINKIIRSRRRTLGLQIAPDARLIVRAPRKLALETIREIVDQRRSWIQRKQQEMRRNASIRTEKKFKAGELLLFQGQWYALRHTELSSPVFEFNGHEFLLPRQCVDRARTLLIDWYQRQAAAIIPQRVVYYSQRSGIAYTRITINDARTRWGSCGYQATLNFSWRLIMCPPQVLDYVVTHELAHVEVRNHSSRFWERVSRLFPDYYSCRLWLKHNTHLLGL
ncbi:MAG: SprT family zinc-dependent metalloprotease [Candidatus Omnitrophica bacterium]|nr:SprT family zinc-dependent metalloprotease [Candidatus Omnitrophota bacterium]